VIVCFDRAKSCRELAGLHPELVRREEYLRLEQTWLVLAHGYQLVQDLPERTEAVEHERWIAELLTRAVGRPH
jgi:hypothetical protein